MQSYRKRITVQMQPVKKNQEKPIINHPRQTGYQATHQFLKRAVSMYRTIMSEFKPLSDEERLCSDLLMKHAVDLEILEKGTREERMEVIRAYGYD